MPNWSEVLQQIHLKSAECQTRAAQFEAQSHQAITSVRKQYLNELHKHTGRNVIAYYSGFLSKPNTVGTEINDEDKNGFMMTVHKLDRANGLDLILHTPGGGIASTQSIVDYLHKMFRQAGSPVPDIRAIVPQIAMSGGTMMACSCKEIWMGKHSNLGPIDPQVNGVPAYGVLREFKTACKEVKSDPSKIAMWQPIIGQYRPTYLSRCENAIDGSNAFVTKQLAAVMFNGDGKAKLKAAKIVKALTHYTNNKSHDRHIHFEECRAMGLNVKSIEDDTDKGPDYMATFQDLVLTVHHCYMHTLMNTQAYKVIENHAGIGMIKNLIQPPVQQLR